MKAKKSGKNNKKLSVSKKKNINFHKLSRQGLINKTAKNLRTKTKRKLERRTHYANLEENKRKEELIEPEKEITGQEMMEMMDENDLDTLIKANSKKKEKRKLEDVEDEGRVFEDYKKLTKDGKEIKRLLPIMTDHGLQEKSEIRSRDQKCKLTLKNYKRTLPEEPQDEDSGIGDGDLSDDEEFETQNDVKLGGKKSVAQILAEKKRFLHEQKVIIGCLALNVVQDPTKLMNLRSLLKMLKTLNPREDVTLYKYALHTILQVFHDLIPGYRIQENTLDNKMRKAKLTTARQELDLIEIYKTFLKSLEIIISGWKDDLTNIGLTAISETSIFCLCDLVVRHPSFNYSINIIHALIPHLDNKHNKIRKLVFDALSHTIKHDKYHNLTLEIVRKVYKLVHRLRFRVKEEVLRVFLSLRGSEMRNHDQVLEQQRANTNQLTHKEKLVKKLTENFRQKTSRKQKKEKRKMMKINKQMESINVNEMKNIENSRHSEIIQTVFGLYIHVLKKRASSKLMSVVLEGLAKFAHLINIEFFSDLMMLMNQFLEDGTLGHRESLHCIKTVFTILSGQGESLSIDPLRFYNQFYRLLIEMDQGEREKNIDTLLDILEQMLIQRRKKVSAAKVLSFTKRIATLCLSLTHPISIPVLVKLKKLFSMFSANEALLDPDPEGCPGMYLPEIPDPEHANSAATAVWEMVVCQRSFHPSTALLAKNILSGIPAREIPAVRSITDRTTKKLLQDFDQSDMKFNPDIPEPTTHLKKIKRKGLKRFFQNGELDLEDFELQSLCEKVLQDQDGDEITDKEEDSDKVIDGNIRKKLKTCHNSKNNSLLNFSDEILKTNEIRKLDSTNPVDSYKDFTEALLEGK